MRPSLRAYRRFEVASLGGHLSYDCQAFAPVRKVTASGNDWGPRSLRCAANQGAWILARKCLPVAEPNSTGPSFSPAPLDQPPWFHGPTTSKLRFSESLFSKVS